MMVTTPRYHPDTARDFKLMVAKIGSQLLAVENLARRLGMPHASVDKVVACRAMFPEMLRTIDAHTAPAPARAATVDIQPHEDDTPPHGIARPT